MKIFIIIIILALSSCKKENKNPIVINDLGNNVKNDTSLAIEKENISHMAKEVTQVAPDSTINRKLILSDSESLLSFYLNDVKTIDRIRESPVIVFTDINKSQYLIAYQYEGSSKNSFDCFEIGYIKDDKSLVKAEKHETSESKFETESNICLGLDLKKIIEVKGSNYSKIEKENSIIITYRDDDYDNSSFLKRYNMPSYYMEYTIKQDKVVKIKFGFDYP